MKAWLAKDHQSIIRVRLEQTSTVNSSGSANVNCYLKIQHDVRFSAELCVSNGAVLKEDWHRSQDAQTTAQVTPYQFIPVYTSLSVMQNHRINIARITHQTLLDIYYNHQSITALTKLKRNKTTMHSDQ
jgi:hypothetical protein